MPRQWWAILIGAALLWLLSALQPILMPFFISLVLAYLGDPVADWLQKLGLSRRLAVGVVFICMLMLVVMTALVVVPMVWRQILQLIDIIPIAVNWLQTHAIPRLEQWTDYDIATDFEQLRAVIFGHWREASTVAAQVLGQLSRSGMALAVWIANLLLIPVVSFYMLLDWDRMKRALRELLPRAFEPTVTRLARECDEVLGAFLRGQLIVMLVLGGIYAIGLSLLGVRFGLLIGLMAGLISIVPYLGAITGILTAELVTFFQFQAMWPMIGVAGVFLVGHLLEGMLLQPLLLGDKIGLHPVAVIFAVMAGGQLFGFVGILLALPVAAIIMVVLRHLLARYLDSALYDNPNSDDASR
ncbi:putative PurR-regulated permease PerM [Kushneria sinocarnis]|uniref:Putative PurR-regulated permease PerM n=1 Tax=Kushneria sinocarnis TaxID=595502 RepID=A0A420WUZ7_9GAMM|nr:AI-2E family transporter [Kushneria sinocarnis]RKR02387.1 putative PurR-regulated permease PerM [Kushneria sinocarnis]